LSGEALAAADPLKQSPGSMQTLERPLDGGDRVAITILRHRLILRLKSMSEQTIC
jgi:hypothetical protein